MNPSALIVLGPPPVIDVKILLYSRVEALFPL